MASNHFQYDLASSNVGIAQYNISSAAGLSAIWDITDDDEKAQRQFDNFNPLNT
jgi:hypothetical protein